ncbi:MAG: hypothetical protein Q8L64_04150 [bacterium]|nr:hypothetical protein [bacterium]
MRQTLPTISLAIAILALAPISAQAAREEARLQIYRPVVSVVMDNVTRTATTTIVVANVGKGTAESVILRDIMRAPEDYIIGVEDWDLGAIGPGEIVQLSYGITFADDAKDGIYRFLATVEGRNIATIAMNSNGFVTVGTEEVVKARVSTASTRAAPERGRFMFGLLAKKALAFLE